jgi:hypothetical protein
MVEGGKLVSDKVAEGTKSLKGNAGEGRKFVKMKTRYQARCKTTYKKASALEEKTTSELNTLLESLSSWVAIIDGPSDDAPIDAVHPQELGELKCAWEKTFHALSISIKTMDIGFCRISVIHSLSCFAHSWFYEINSSFYWMYSVSSCLVESA